MRLSFPSCALLLVVALSSCKRAAAPSDPLERVPASSSAVVFGPSMLDATSQIAAFIKRLEDTQGAIHTSNLTEDAVQRIGFNPFTSDGLKSAGFKPDGAFIIAVNADGSGNTWFLPVSDEKKALATLEGFARQADQADRIKDEKLGELNFKTFARPFGSREVPVMAAAVSNGFLVVARGPKGADHVKSALQVKREESFAQGAVFKALGGRVPSTPIRFVVDASHAGAIAKDARAAEKVVKFLAGGFTPGTNGIDINLIAELVDEKRDAVLQALFPKGVTLPLTTVLDGDAVVAGQGTLVLDTAKKLAESVDPNSVNNLRLHVSRLGFGDEEDLMSLTDGHYAGALYLAPASEFSSAMKEGKPLQQQLMRFAPFLVMMRPKTGQTPDSIIEFLKQRFTQRGLQVAVLDGEAGTISATWNNQPTWRSYQAAVVEGVALVGGGAPDRFRAALKKLRAKAAPIALDDGASDALMRADASTLIIRLPAISARLDEVVKSDLGDGADALMARTLINRVRQLAGIAKNITLELHPDGKQLSGALKVPLQKASP